MITNKMNCMIEKISWFDFINQLNIIQNKLSDKLSISDNDYSILKKDNGFTLSFLFHKISYPGLTVNFKHDELELLSNTTEYHIPLDDIKNYDESYFILTHGRLITQYELYYKILKLMTKPK